MPLGPSPQRITVLEYYEDVLIVLGVKPFTTHAKLKPGLFIITFIILYTCVACSNSYAAYNIMRSWHRELKKIKNMTRSNVRMISSHLMQESLQVEWNTAGTLGQWQAAIETRNEEKGGKKNIYDHQHPTVPCSPAAP